MDYLKEPPKTVYSFNKNSKGIVNFLNSGFRFVEYYLGESPTVDGSGYFYSTFSSSFPVDSSLVMNEEKIEGFLVDVFNFTKNKSTKISWAKEPEATLGLDSNGNRIVKLEACLTAR